MRTRGFTLVEMLVATGVFMIGFTAAFTMFLAAGRARVQADGILRLTLVAASLIEEFRLEAGREGAGTSRTIPALTACPPYPPTDYVGDGFAKIDSPAEVDPAAIGDLTPLFPYQPQPGIWYRVLSCVDEKGASDDQLATTLQMDIIIIWNPLPDPTMTMGELARRQRFVFPPLLTTDEEKLDALVTFLAKRGFALRERAVIVRHASWDH